MAERILTVQAPYAGINRRMAYQTQPPFSSYDSLNYWPIDVKTGRLTTAVRPPLKLFGGTQAEVCLIEQVNGIAAGLPSKSFCASYNGNLYYWNGSTMVASGGAQAGSIDTGQYVSAASVVNQLVIAKSGAKPIVFDYPTQSAATLVESAGTCPTGATIAVQWQGALWLALNSTLYASRVGDITDHDTSVALTDYFGAFFTDGDYKGILAGPITSCMPQTANVMMVSTVSGTLAMRGHPRQGGVFEPVGSSYALGQGAWCLTPDGTLLLLTPIGLMSLAASPGAVMAPVSRDKIPDELVGLSYDRDDPLVTMKYDTRWNGVHIYVRGAQEQAWWFDMNTGGFHRMEVASYPFALMEFQDFITESTSGIMLGRYDGIYTYDRFADETINSSIVMGPVKISQSTMNASKILNARVTFARDTPTGTGSFRVATGLDGQDAVNRLLNGEHQYEIPLTALEDSYGMCYPDATGHAAVFAFDTDTGDLAVEEITVNVKQMGRLTFNRGTQISVTGEASEFSGAYIDLDVDIWAGYSEATPVATPDENLPDYTHFLDLSLLPQSWWDEVKGPDGEDIRVADDNDVQAPSTLIDFSLVGQIGMLAFRMTQATATKKVKVWVGNEDAAKAPKTSTYGQYNVFDSYWRGFWPDAAGNTNQTQYGNNTATLNKAGNVSNALVPFYGDSDGPMGAKATTFDSGDYTYWTIAGWLASQSLTLQKAWTFGLAYKLAAGATVVSSSGVGVTNSGSTRYHRVDPQHNGTTGTSSTAAKSHDGIIETAGSNAGGTAIANWRMHTGVFTDVDNRAAFIDGTQKGSQVGNADAVVTDFTVGLNGIINSLEGLVAMVQVHTTPRSDAWVKYQGDMMDQTTFWGTLGAFTLVNSATPDSLNTAACPIGQVPQTETGNTAGYVQLMPVDPTDGSVVKFSCMIDLSIMPAGWWTEVVNAGLSGTDIRATNAANTILPFDLIEIDTAASTGLAVVRTSQAEGAPSAIRIWAGNASAIVVDDCNAYGKYTAYDSTWYGFWPAGSGNDRTQYLNHLTTVGSPAVTDLASPVGSQATTYANSGGTFEYATGTNDLPTGNPITLTASVKKPTGDLHTDSVIVSIQDSGSKSGVFLHTRPSSTPARLSNRNSFGTEATAGNSTAITASNWWFQAGLSFGNHTRVSYVNEAAGSSSSSLDTVILDNLNTVSIAAEYAATPVRGMNATICLVGLHGAARGVAWVSYWDKTLDQATFWSVGAWVADPTALS